MHPESEAPEVAEALAAVYAFVLNSRERKDLVRVADGREDGET